MKTILNLLLIALAILACLSAFYLRWLPEACIWKYFFVPFHELLSIGVAGIVFYLYVEYKNDIRSKKKLVENIADRVIQHTADPCIYRIKETQSIRHALIIQRTIENELNLLEKYSSEFGFVDEMSYCKNMLNEYKNLIGECVPDIKKFREKENELEDKTTKLANKMECIISKLYK